MFCCPNCGSLKVVFDLPQAYMVVTYDVDGELVKQDTNSGDILENGRCSSCDLVFDVAEWEASDYGIFEKGFRALFDQVHLMAATFFDYPIFIGANVTLISDGKDFLLDEVFIRKMDLDDLGMKLSNKVVSWKADDLECASLLYSCDRVVRSFCNPPCVDSDFLTAKASKLLEKAFHETAVRDCMVKPFDSDKPSRSKTKKVPKPKTKRKKR